MAEFYKMNPAKWDNGTAGLTLEQEAAYLRIVNAINKADEPCPANPHVLSGMFRCNTQRAKRLLADLVAAGKVWIEDGKIYNEHAMSDVRVRCELRATRQHAGKLGGTQKQLNRVNSLKTNKPNVANATPREEKRREEKNIPPKPPKGGDDDFEAWYSLYPRKDGKVQARRAFKTALGKVDPATMIDAVRRFAALVAGKDRQFIPLPATWLNGEKWADESIAPKPPPGAGAVPLLVRVERAKQWLRTNPDVPVWMDNREVADELIKEGYDYDALRKAGFSLPPRGRVVDISEMLPGGNQVRRGPVPVTS